MMINPNPVMYAEAVNSVHSIVTTSRLWQPFVQLVREPLQLARCIVW